MTDRYFDRFYTTLSTYSKSSNITYLGDQLFKLIIGKEYKQHKRMSLGWVSWIVYASKVIFFSGIDLSHKYKIDFSRQHVFFIKETVAHYGSLIPIAQQHAKFSTLLMTNDITNTFGLRHVLLKDVQRGLSKKDTIKSLFLSLVDLINFIHKAPNQTISLSLKISKSHLLMDLLFEMRCEHTKLKHNDFSEATLYITQELSSIEKTLVTLASNQGARVIHVSHGQRRPYYQVTRSSDLVLFSSIDEPWFRKRVPTNVKIWTIGHPRLESIRSEIGPPREHAPDQKPRITYFSQPAEGDYSQELRKNDWSILRGLQGKAEIRFRLHPRESRADAIKDLKSLDIDFLQISDAGLHEDLRWSDAVVSSWSTVSMEAASCGRGIFWACCTPEKYEASQELRDAGVGALIQSPQEWDEQIQNWHNAGWNSPIRVSEEQLMELGMIGDMEKTFLERLGIHAEGNCS